MSRIFTITSPNNSNEFNDISLEELKSLPPVADIVLSSVIVTFVPAVNLSCLSSNCDRVTSPPLPRGPLQPPLPRRLHHLGRRNNHSMTQ